MWTKVRDCAPEAEFRGCTIQVDGKLTGQVVGNRELLRRAVENVLRNGIRYSPERATIELSVQEDDRKATIAIRDYGPGVPSDALGRIFDPFFRVEAARDANGGGSGLGLSIAKRAIQLHQGAISAQNALPGLRVQITIPLAPSPTLRSTLHSFLRIFVRLRILKLHFASGRCVIGEPHPFPQILMRTAGRLHGSASLVPH